MLPAIGTLALICAWIGWDAQVGHPDDALFKAVHVVAAGSDYTIAADLKSNLWLHAARWLGLAFFVLTATKALGLLLSRQITETFAQFATRDVVLIGDHAALGPMTKLIAPLRKTLWLAPEDTKRIARAHVVARGWSEKLGAHYRIAQAQIVVIAFAADDVQSLEVAKQLNAIKSDLDVIILSDSLPPIQNETAFSGVHHVRVVAHGAAIIRSLHREYPPFEKAAAGQERLHCVLIGCGRMGEQVLSDLLLSSLVPGLGKPIATIIDPRAAEIRASLVLRCPELEKSIDLNFLVPHGREDARALPIDELRALASVPFSSAYVCLGDDRASLAAGVLLAHLARSEQWALKRVFVRQSCSESTVGDAMRQAYDRIVPFGTVDQLVRGLGLDHQDPDILPRAIHASYRVTAPSDAPANVEWAELPEVWREANRRVVTHLPAKLASLGSVAAIGQGPSGAVLDQDLLERLAEIEHERWMAERRLGGWRYGARRDDALRLHPDLTPFAMLSEGSRQIDRDIVAGLLQVAESQDAILEPASGLKA